MALAAYGQVALDDLYQRWRVFTDRAVAITQTATVRLTKQVTVGLILVEIPERALVRQSVSGISYTFITSGAVRQAVGTNGSTNCSGSRRPAPSGADGSGAPAPGRRHPSGPPSAASPGRSGAPQKAIFQSRVARRRLRPAAARCRPSDSRRRSWLRAAPSPAISAAWPKVSRRGRTWALPEVPGSYRSTRPVSYPSSAHRW